MHATSLCIVLVGPEQAANVGFVARTMACYGLNALRIVGSPGIASDGAALKTGKAVPEVLAAATYFPSLEAAIADCQLAFGFTRRSREPSQTLHEVAGAARFWRNATHISEVRTALVFGRESQGLFREETLLLSHLVRIATPSETISLNVSHAVAIALYAFTGADDVPKSGSETRSVSSAEEFESSVSLGESSQVLQSLLVKLSEGGFFKGGKEPAQKEYVRLLWQRLRPTRRETDFLAGLIRTLSSSPNS